MAFEALAARGRRALADGNAGEAARVLRDALLAWRGQPLADAAGCDLGDAVAAKMTELRSSALADRIEADLALGEGASLVGEPRVLLSADPLAERCADGLTPSWSASSSRPSWYAASAPAWRPTAYSARMSRPRSRSCPLPGRCSHLRRRHGGEPRQDRVTRDPGPERHGDYRPAVVSAAGSSSADGLPWSW